MERFFNTAGPTIPDDHYHIDPLHRVDWEEIQHLMDHKRYFVLHAPRQTGKTSTLLAMMKVINAQGRYSCAYANIEGAQAARGDETQGIPAVCDALSDSVELYTGCADLKAWYRKNKKEFSPQYLLASVLRQWAMISSRPVILFLDEVDALVGDTLISLLRQIRSGYAQRPEAFPRSIILCGVRDVRDYRIHQEGGEIITGGSAFNIKAKSLRMGNFSLEEVRALWLQHTQETGQEFKEDIFPELWEDTRGQPWLVNALGHEVTWEMRALRDRTRKITLTDYLQAREQLIISRATHLDQLGDKLREPRVHGVISALLAGEETLKQVPDDDLQYVEDLGLIQLRPSLRISNRIYREVIPRELTWSVQTMISNQETAWYVKDDHSLDIFRLLEAFQQFFREHSEIWEEGFDYREAAPQLLLQAFLQRILNSGGRLLREYGLGRKRTDLIVEWPLDPQKNMYGPLQRVVIELKILRGDLEKTIQTGLEQTADYADRVKADEAHLIIFNRDRKVSWGKKIFRRQETHQSRSITVWGA
ncbi:AAA-like domain-containing protein [Desulfonatronospira sp.]|uniref:AAA-like domain-containing protein n=1 Tax=Desulfonatronospira sp. TaxID=1962951 RepID=UPI0025C09870|nr:AAA-like domain-containing protein [Desulfonatronospira sp.]